MPKKINKWKLVSKKGKNFEIFFISILATSLAPAVKPKLKRPLQLITSAFLQIQGNRYFLKAELDKHINKLTKLLKEKPSIIIDGYEYYLRLLNKMESFAKTIPQKDFNRLDLIKYLEKWSSYLNEAIQYGYNYYFLNQPTANIILKVLERNQVKDIFSAFEILSQAKNLSIIQQEKGDLLKLVKKIKEYKLSINSQSFNKIIKNHLKKYAFMGMYYFRGRPWQTNDVLIRLKSWLKNDWQNELRKLNRLQKANLETKRLIKKYKFTLYKKKIITLMKEMTYSINRYDEVHNFYSLKSQPLLKYIAKKISVSYAELIEINFTELLNLLKLSKKATLAFRKILRLREQNSALITIKGKTKILTDNQAKKFFQQEIGKEKIIYKDILKGQCACAGKVSGRVVVFKSVADISKVKKGNVMVAYSTVPSFVPAMEKAEAIVTEMGGLLSHAAIVSRELGISCVIGVENATKVLKDGDKVEVDATKGIVKKL